MRHLYECPMRFSDMDALQHVNNVSYVDYMQEARSDLLHYHPSDKADLPGLLVVAQGVTYLQQMHVRPEPLRVEVWVTEIKAATFTLAYELFHLVGGRRHVYATAYTTLSQFHVEDGHPIRISAEMRELLGGYLEASDLPPKQPILPKRLEITRQPVTVRYSDLDPYGHVNNVKYFEYFQEARIGALSLWRTPDALTADGARVHGDDAFGEHADDAMEQVRKQTSTGRLGSMVVAAADVYYHQSAYFRPEPYEAYCWVERVGTKSVTMGAVLVDPLTDETIATGRWVMVLYDFVAKRTTEATPEVRALLEQLM